MPTSTGETVTIATVVSVAMQYAPRLVHWLNRHSIDQQKVTLEGLREEQKQLDASFQRLEDENTRMATRIRELEQQLVQERKHSARLESALRRHGITIQWEDG